MAVTAIFGGTFNPFHIGHYEMLSAVCGQDNIDRVLLMPDNIPPHKRCDFLADDEHRINMCALVCRDFPKAELCLIEFERQGKSYTYDTVKRLKELYPDEKFAFVIGGDMLASLNRWYNWQELLKMLSFIVFPRDDGLEFSKNLEKMRELGADITVIDRKIPDVSSTELRTDIKKELLPEAVYNYITENEVYGLNDTRI